MTGAKAGFGATQASACWFPWPTFCSLAHSQSGLDLLRRQERLRGVVLGLITSGCYLFGSVQVAIMASRLLLNGAGPGACARLLVPMSGGVAFTVTFVCWAKNALEADCQTKESSRPLLGRGVSDSKAAQPARLL
ncbi:unnamed protein product [Symbiodinium natans]|uniref:Uncharacterized protein n=1 Tax=Symbiodinium natans TaxID=878477 RepID=A0A812NUR2_9DINO|nr:unnamed protein product [Symbiodinium natans]